MTDWRLTIHNRKICEKHFFVHKKSSITGILNDIRQTKKLLCRGKMRGRMWVNEWASEEQGVHRGASLLKKDRSNSEHSLIRSTFHIDLCINKYIYFLLIISQIVTTYKNSFLFLYFCCCLERSKKAEKKYVWPFLFLAFPSLQLVFVPAFTSLWLTSDFCFTSPYF